MGIDKLASINSHLRGIYASARSLADAVKREEQRRRDRLKRMQPDAAAFYEALDRGQHGDGDVGICALVSEVHANGRIVLQVHPGELRIPRAGQVVSIAHIRGFRVKEPNAK